MTWNRQNGLPVNGITSIAQTKDGYIWMGTAAGLVRFDGIDFKLHDLAQVAALRNSNVTAITPAKNGGLWVGVQHSSFGFYDGKRFTSWAAEKRGKLEMNPRYLHENADGTLWLIAQRQGSKLSKSGEYTEVYGTSETTGVNILTGYEDPTGRIWFGTAFSGISFWDTDQTVTFPDATLLDLPVTAITTDQQGNVWVGTSEGLRCYDPRFHRKEIPPLTDYIRTLLIDRQGVLWIGTGNKGLARYQSGNYSFISKNEGLASAFVDSLLEDNEGSLWVGTRDGVSLLSNVKFPTFRAAENPAIKDAWAVTSSHDGGIWICSSGGVSYFDGKLKTYFTDAGLPNDVIKRAFEARNGDVYLVGGRNARDLIVLSKGRVVATYPAPTMLVGITEDDQGIVVSSGGGLYRVGPGGLTPYVFLHGEPPLNWVLNLLLAHDGAIWAATEEGIFRIKDGDFKSWKASDGLAGAIVQGLCEDRDGVIWGGLLTGIVRLKDNKIRVINHNDGLFDNNVYATVPDDFGNMWMDSGRGVFRATLKNLNDFCDGKTSRVECTVFDGSDSVMTSDKTSQERVGCKTKDGRIWFPGPHGVVMIDPSNVPINQVQPPIQIDRVIANGHETDASGGIAVPPGNGELEIHFSALSFIAPHRIKARYQLAGYDKDWVDAGERRTVFYTNLKPGKYQFRIIAANADGVWNETGATLPIEFRPHFHQTLWFYLLCGSVGCTLLAGIYLWRIHHLNRKQQALQKARDQLEIEVRNRTAELATSNLSLTDEIGHHKITERELQQRTDSLETEIEERKRAQREVERIHRELLATSRQAGMAEVATGVLHNVGNVLNSVNVSTTLVADHVRRSKTVNVAKLSEMLNQHKENVGDFLTNDPKGRMIPVYLETLATDLASEQKAVISELDNLRKNVEHIKDIVAMQQNYAKNSGFTETVLIPDLIEDALRINAGSLARHGIDLRRDYQVRPTVTLDKHKVIQILINLVRNAKYACDESGRGGRSITIRTTCDEQKVRIAVIDDGIGISSENLTRIFGHGFTTRKEGHGFGLHSGALAARELGGSLNVHSDGPGKGAVFTLELPLKSENPNHAKPAA